MTAVKKTKIIDVILTDAETNLMLREKLLAQEEKLQAQEEKFQKDLEKLQKELEEKIIKLLSRV